MRIAEIKKTIREVPDFPRPGINFYDLMPLFRDAAAFRASIERMVERFRGEPIDAVAGIEARGFVLGSVLAYELGVGMIAVRKKGKLPGETDGESYELEYGEAHIEIQHDAVEPGQKVIVVDDLLATGGTVAAALRLFERRGAEVVGCAFLVELGFLEGRKRIGSDHVFSLIRYE